MNERLRKLLEARARVWEEMKAIRDRAAENDDGTIRGEDEQAWQNANTEIERLGQQIEQEERALQLDTVDRSRVPAPRDEHEEERDEATADERYAEAFDMFVRHGAQDLTTEQRTVLRGGFVSGQELRAQGVGTLTAGGYLAPKAWRDRIIEAADTIANVAAVADLLQTDSGEAMAWVTEDDTANEGAILAESTQVTEQDMAWGTSELGAYMYTSKLVRVSLQLLQDNAYDAEQRLGTALARRIGRAQNRHFTTGTGTAQPEGIVTNAVVGKTGATGQTTTVTYDDLIDLELSVLESYRADGRYMFSDASLGGLRKLKDANGTYLWQPSLQVGAPNTINGHPYVVNNYMPAPAASAKSILFGDFREGFVVRRVRDVQLLRLAERYADFLQVGFLAFNRADSKQQNAQAYKAYQHSAT
jgi:HK97 family phage major capsid protein